jgi:hypothetical protein
MKDDTTGLALARQADENRDQEIAELREALASAKTVLRLVRETLTMTMGVVDAALSPFEKERKAGEHGKAT